MAKHCAHVNCGCETEGKEFCCTHCAQVAAMHDENAKCECHHLSCKQPR